MFPLFAADHLVNADAGQPAVNDREDDEPLDFGENLGDRGPHGLDTDEAVDAVAAREQLSEVPMAMQAARYAAMKSMTTPVAPFIGKWNSR